MDSKIWVHFLLLDHFVIARIPEKFDNFTKWRWIWLNQATYAWQHGLCYAMLRFKNQICPILSESYIIHFSKCYRYVQFSSRPEHAACAACMQCSALISSSFFIIIQCKMNTRSDKKYKILALLAVLSVLSVLKVHKKSIK